MKTVRDTSSKSSSGKVSHVRKMFLSSIAAVGSSMSLFTTVFWLNGCSMVPPSMVVTTSMLVVLLEVSSCSRSSERPILKSLSKKARLAMWISASYLL